MSPATPLAAETGISRRLPPASRRTDAVWILSVAAIYFAAARLGLALVIQPSGIAPVWLPSGVFLTAILLTRRNLRPWLVGALCLTDLAAELLAGTSPALGVAYALTLTGDAVLSAWLLLRFVGNPITFRRVRDVVGWLLLSVLLSNAIAALVAAAAASVLAGASFWGSWSAWAIADGIGNLLVMPLALSWAAWAGTRWLRQPRRELEGAALVILMAGLNYVAFFGLPQLSEFSEVLTYLNFPFLLWAALRFQMRGVTSALVIMAGIVIADAVGSPGVGELGASSVGAVALAVQLFIALMAVPALFVAAEASERSDTEAARLAADRRHGTTLRSIGDAVITTDPEGRVALLNPVAETLTGWRHDEAVGRPVDEVFRIISEATRLPAENPVARVMREGGVVGLANHTSLISRDGVEHPIADSGAPILDEQGRSLGVVLVFRDQTAERAAHQALRESRALLQSIIDGTTDAVYAKDLEGRYTLFNRGAERITGRNAAAVLGRDDTFLFPPDEAAVAMDGDRRVMEQAAPLTYEERVTTAAGAVSTFLSTKGPMRDATGAVTGVFGITRDITERKAAEDAMRRLALVLDAAPNSITVHDFDGHFLYANPRTFELHGYSAAEFLILNLQDVDMPTDAALIAARIEMLRERGEASFEVEHRRKDGTILPLAVTIRNTVWDGREAILSVATDITQRKAAEAEVLRLNAELEQRVIERTEKLEAANQQLRSFSYSVSHDLRAPLRAVAGFAEILNQRYRDRLDETGAHYLDNVVTSSMRMGVLIDELLDYSRVGQGSIRVEPVALAPIIDHLRTVFGSRMDEAGATLVVPGPLATPMGDRLLLEQILLNLVDNALTYRRPDVPPQITLSAVRHGRTVTLAVADNGIGIAPEYQERIFEVFTRLHSEGEYAGTGVGLATVRKAAQLMGSDVTVASKEGEGSTFSLVLPAAR